MTKVFVDTTKIADWPSFHRVFSQIFGFPAFYGNKEPLWSHCRTTTESKGALRPGRDNRPVPQDRRQSWVPVAPAK
nr:barstar family protein [Burkholderia ubonensis]